MTDVADIAGGPLPPLMEQRFFELSPLGTFASSLVVFAFLFGSFEGLAAITHYPLADQISFSPKEGAWPAAILSLLVAVALGMQRYVRQKDVEESPTLAALMPCDPANMAVDSASARRRIKRAGWLGAAVGLAFCFIVVPSGVPQQHWPVFLWFTFIMMLLGTMFARGAAMTRIAAQGFSKRIDRDLKIDLLRIDRLSIIGRSSARAALIWVCVAAVICLFFVSGHAPGPVIATVVLSTGMAVWIFFRSLERVHKRIVLEKRKELETLRTAIAEQRTIAVRDHAAAMRLQGLLAYEARIEHVHEWPFDQLTLLRMASYVLIPASPAVGQLVMRYLTHSLS